MLALCIFLSAIVLFCISWYLVFRTLRIPAPPFIGIFLDSFFRRWLQPPEQVIERSDIKPGMTVLEIGCGSGAFIAYTARKVGKNGKAYGLDLQAGMLNQVERKLAKPEYRDIDNIFLVRASAHFLPFKDDSFDLVYMVTALPEVNDRSKALKEVKRVLKPGGVLSVTELLPDPDYPLRSFTIKLVRGEGFVLDKKFGNFFNYTVRFRRP